MKTSEDKKAIRRALYDLESLEDKRNFDCLLPNVRGRCSNLYIFRDTVKSLPTMRVTSTTRTFEAVRDPSAMGNALLCEPESEPEREAEYALKVSFACTLPVRIGTHMLIVLNEPSR